MTLLTMASFFLVFVLCLAGLFSPRYQDNWPQHLGLIGMGITSVSAIHRVYHLAWVPPEMVLFSVAAALFGCGTAYKVWHHRKSYQRRAPANKSVPSKAS
jgi:hypothetical protein